MQTLRRWQNDLPILTSFYWSIFPAWLEISGISNKSAFETAKMAQCIPIWHRVHLDLTCHYTKYVQHSTIHVWDITKIHNSYMHKYHILAQSQSIFYVHKATMMVDHNMNKIQIHLKYITINILHLWNINEHKCYTLAQHQGIFYMHQVSIVVDYITKYEQNQSTLFWDIACNKHITFKRNIAIITQIWHRAKYYFTCVRNTWYLIIVPNMNKINPFFSVISQQIHKMYVKVAIITHIWHRATC